MVMFSGHGHADEGEIKLAFKSGSMDKIIFNNCILMFFYIVSYSVPGLIYRIKTNCLSNDYIVFLNVCTAGLINLDGRTDPMVSIIF